MISLETYIEAALYAPGIGYYTRPGERVGYMASRDFYTAESLGGVFARLIIAGCRSLLPDEAGGYGFIELGAEPGSGLLASRSHPFATAAAFGCQDTIELKGPKVVFSNELFDAQPFRRFEYRDSQWHEHGLRLAENEFEPILLHCADDAIEHLPKDAPEGYLLDDPSGARRLIRRLAAENWNGLFIAFDYGLDRETLHHARPQGTGRTYRDHQLGTDLLAQPGQTDLTHHICWDDLQETLAQHGFEKLKLESQESFFMHHAQKAVAKIVESAASKGLSRDLQTLKELLHPEHMGRKFQVLTGFRPKNSCHSPCKNR